MIRLNHALLYILIIMFCEWCPAADLNLRTLTQTWDVRTTASTKVPQCEFYRGESYTLNLQAKSAREPVDLSATNLLTTWELADWNNLSNGWLIVTGEVTSATNGMVQFTLTPAQTDQLAPGYYRGEVWSMIPAEDGTNRIKAALLAAQRVEVLDSAAGRYASTMRAPYPWEDYSDRGDQTLSNSLYNAWESTDSTVQWLDAWQTSFSNDWKNHTESFKRLETNLTAESSARLAADAALSNALYLASAMFGSNISAEASARLAGDSALTNALALASATLGSNISAETSARIAGDAALSATLAELSSNAVIASVEVINSNITAEATARADADGVLATNLATVASSLAELESNAVTAVQSVGGYYHPDWFTLSTKPYPYLIISEGETNSVNSVYANTITVDSAAGYLLVPDIVRMSTFTGDVSYTALSNCSIQTVTVTNYYQFAESQVTDYDAVIFDDALPSGAVATITATLGTFSRALALTYQPSNLYSYYQYQGDKQGSLRAYVNTSLAARAAVTNLSIKLFEDGWPSYGSGGTWVRNTNCWVYGIDLTCASPYNTQGNQAEKGGTAITRQHVVYANHYPITNGASLLFVDLTNGLHWRQQVDSRRIGLTDCQIGLLDEPLPESITPAQLMQPADNGRFLGALNMSGGIGIRAIHLKAVEGNDPKVFAKWACYARVTSADAEAGLMGSADAAIGRTVEGHPFSAQIVVGDSGQPTFILIGTNTVLYSTFRSSMGGPNIGYLGDLIEDAIADMGNSTHTNLNHINLGAWSDYGMPPTP